MSLIRYLKAFGKVNHFALFLKLMDRNAPLHFIKILASWLPIIAVPALGSTVYYPSLSNRILVFVKALYYRLYCLQSTLTTLLNVTVAVVTGEIIVYADDILFITRTVTGLQNLFDIVEQELKSLDSTVNK
jgi:hypothetical protein